MAVGLLETKGGYGVAGWDDIDDNNVNKLNTQIGNMLQATDATGSAQHTDVPALTAQTLTDNTGGTASDTINAQDFDPGAATAAALTDNSGGTATQTIGAIVGSGADAAINDNFASVTDEVNKIITDVAAIRTKQQAADDLLNDALASLVDEINKLRADLEGFRQKYNTKLADERTTGGIGLWMD